MAGLLEIDRDLEARKHLWRGLARMGKRERVAFVGAMCKEVSKTQEGAATRVTSHTGTVYESFADLLLLSVNHGLDLYKACERLERWLSRR